MTRCTRRITVLFVCLLCWSSAVARAQQASISNTETNVASREVRLRVFDQVWRSINENYYDRNFHGLDWIAQRNTFRPLIEQAASNAEFYRLMRAMVGKLGDAHQNLFARRRL